MGPAIFYCFFLLPRRTRFTSVSVSRAVILSLYVDRLRRIADVLRMRGMARLSRFLLTHHKTLWGTVLGEHR